MTIPKILLLLQFFTLVENLLRILVACGAAFSVRNTNIENALTPMLPEAIYSDIASVLVASFVRYKNIMQYTQGMGACATMSIADVLFEVEVGRLFGAKADNHMNEIWSYIMTNHRM